MKQPIDGGVPASAEELRAQEVDALWATLDEALETITDIDVVNEHLAASERPDLVMSERAPMKSIEFPYDPIEINNFTTYMAGFGIFEDNQPGRYGPDGSIQPMVRRQPSEQERDMFFLLGARGGYAETRDFAAEHGIDEGIVMELQLSTHLPRPAFMRMWVLFPELTESLMATLLNKNQPIQQGPIEEVYAAYSIMSQLVDINDSSVIRNGAVDDFHLCR